MRVPDQEPDAVPGAAPAGPAGPAASAGPASVAEALAMAKAGLGWLAAADLAEVPVAVQADCLRELERTASMHAAAQARAVSAFMASRGFEADGQYSAKTWLRWQARTTPSAAGASVAAARRLAAHPAVAEALAGGGLSVSWGRAICEWSDELPAAARADADAILLAAAAGGAELADLAELAERIRRRVAGPDQDPDGSGPEDRWLRLGRTFRGAGRLDGGLSPRCAAALQAVLESLGKRAGPEDDRSGWQRDHDALEEACLRLLASGCLPDRAGQPVQLQLHLTLDQLLGYTRGNRGTSQGTGSQGISGESTGGPGDSGCPGRAGGTCCGQPAAAPGDECDTTIVPVVTGRVDHDLLDRLAAALTGHGGLDPATALKPAAAGLPGTGICPGTCQPASHSDDAASHGRHGHGGHDEQGHRVDDDGEEAGRWRKLSFQSARELILRHAIALLSGPDGLAAYLRTGTLTGPAASISLPLDAGTATETIPAHLRRAVIARDRHCRFPGCRQRPAACQIHHLVPRGQGGRTHLPGLVLLCSFHHLIVIHQWGWRLTLNADGATTAVSPDGQRVYNSHSPPAAA